MKSHSLTHSLALTLVATLLIISAAHMLLDNRALHPADGTAHSAPASAGDGCCVFICLTIAASLVVLLPAVARLNRPLGQLAASMLPTLPILLDPPPRLNAAFTARTRV